MRVPNRGNARACRLFGRSLARCCADGASQQVGRTLILQFGGEPDGIAPCALTSLLPDSIMMKAQMDIYEQIVQLRREGRRGAVATITNVRGSIPSFQTAKMLVRDEIGRASCR